MVIKSLTVKNFASYESLEINFSSGLVLIQGPTGSGKSTLSDTVPWILFGVTAKGGSVTDVLTWPGTSVTEGTADLGGWSVVRLRGPKAKDNDLYILENDQLTRGKDLLDTQRLINVKLGMTPDLYFAGSYYHEFSQTAGFFTTTPKIRRQLCEQIVDLSLPKHLQEASTVSVKKLKEDLARSKQNLDSFEYKLTTTVKAKDTESDRSTKWEADRIIKLQTLTSMITEFGCVQREKLANYEVLHAAELERQRQPGECGECGHETPGNQHAHTSKYEAVMEEIRRAINPYVSLVAKCKQETNPYTKSEADYTKEIGDITYSIGTTSAQILELETQLEDLQLIQSSVTEFRSLLIQDTIYNIQAETNRVLATYFDSEMSVLYSVQEADKLDITVYKNANQASFVQLSKGQRQTLRLSFAVAIMKAASRFSGVQFPFLFFDEALDGMDDSFKSKAFDLFQELSMEYESVFVVEHSSDFKTRFDKTLTVRLENGHSKIEAA